MATAKNEMPTATFTHELVAGNLAAAAKSAGAEAGKTYMIPPASIKRLDGFNVRVKTPDYIEHRKGIEKSIRANGFYPNKPLGGYVAKEEGENVFYLTDGYTRLDAVDSLNDEEFGDGGEKITLVPFTVKPATANLEDLTVALIQDNEGRPLSVYERALVVGRLKSYNMSDDEIARRLNITTRYVADLTTLAGAPASVRGMLINGKISATEAVKQLRKKGEKAGAAIKAAVDNAEKAGKKKATGKDVKKASGEPTRKAAKAAKTAKASEAAPVATPGKLVIENSYVFVAGSIVTADAIKPVARVLGDDLGWWNYVDDSKETVFIEEDMEISVTVIRNAPQMSQDGDDVSTGADAPETGEEGAAAQPEPDTGDL